MRPHHLPSHGVSPVIGIILLVAITVVLAAVLYYTSSQLVQNQEVNPYVAVTLIEQNDTVARVQIVEVSVANLNTTRFQVVLVINGTVDSASRIRPLVAGTQGNVTYRSLDGVLNAGDDFVVRVTPDHTYLLSIIILDTGSQVGSQTFFT